MLLLADAVAVVHGLAIAVMLTGGLLALRWPRLLWLHVPVALTILVLNAAGADCPLTDLELSLRGRAGSPGYSGGYIGHHTLAPLGIDVHTADAQALIYTLAVVPNAAAYALHARRWLRARRPRPDPATRRAPRRPPPRR